jgi:hypothetical protein
LSGVISPTRLTAVAAAAIALSGCATFTDADDVAVVGDVHIEESEFTPLLEEYADRGDLFGTTPVSNGRASADEARFLLGAVVGRAAFLDFVDEQGLSADDARTAFLDSIPPGDGLATVSPAFADLVADVNAQVQQTALAPVEPPPTDELRAMYAADPASIGVLCMRHILVPTRADAEAVLARLADGADFATVAAETSTDTGTAVDGGALRGGDNECIPLQGVLQGFDPGFVAGALEAREGVVSEPVETSFGWHLILHRPWDEVAGAIAELYQPGTAGAYLFAGYFVGLDVHVDPRYGDWDRITRTVVPIG